MVPYRVTRLQPSFCGYLSLLQPGRKKEVFINRWELKVSKIQRTHFIQKMHSGQSELQYFPGLSKLIYISQVLCGMWMNYVLPKLMATVQFTHSRAWKNSVNYTILALLLHLIFWPCIMFQHVNLNANLTSNIPCKTVHFCRRKGP